MKINITYNETRTNNLFYFKPLLTQSNLKIIFIVFFDHRQSDIFQSVAWFIEIFGYRFVSILFNVAPVSIQPLSG